MEEDTSDALVAMETDSALNVFTQGNAECLQLEGNAICDNDSDETVASRKHHMEVEGFPGDSLEPMCQKGIRAESTERNPGVSLEEIPGDHDTCDVKPALVINGAESDEKCAKHDTNSLGALIDIKPRLSENGEVIEHGAPDDVMTSDLQSSDDSICDVSAKMQPYIPLVDIGALSVQNQPNAQNSLNPQSQLAAPCDFEAPSAPPQPGGLVLPVHNPHGADPVQASILKGGFSVVQCQNGTLLIPTNPVRRNSQGELQNVQEELFNARNNFSMDSNPVFPEVQSVTPNVTKISKRQFRKDAPRPFQCLLCDKTFTLKAYVNKHINRVHGGKAPVSKKKTAPKRSGLKFVPFTPPGGVGDGANTYGKRVIVSTSGNEPTSASAVVAKETWTYNKIEYQQKYICTVCDKLVKLKAGLIKHMLKAHTREVYQCGRCRRSFNTENRLKKHIESHAQETHNKENSGNDVKLDSNDVGFSDVSVAVGDVSVAVGDVSVTIGDVDITHAQVKQENNDSGVIKSGIHGDVSDISPVTGASQGNTNETSAATTEIGLPVLVKQEPVDIEITMETDPIGDAQKQEGDEKNGAFNKNSIFDDFYYDSDSKSRETDVSDNDDVHDDDDDSDYVIDEQRFPDDELVGRKKVKKKRDCEVCETRFKSHHAYLEHVRKGHNKRYPCTICGTDFRRRKDMMQHVQDSHQEALPYQCVTCHQRFSSERGLNQHHSQKHEENTDSKTTVNDSADNKTITNSRNREKSSVPRYKCQECDQTFAMLREFNRHMNEVHPDIEYKSSIQCDICEKLINRSGFFTHQRACSEGHFDGEFYHCAPCGKQFSELNKLTTHNKQAHTRRFKCTHCDKGFGQKAQLDSHMVQHGAEKKFMCDICSKFFISRNRLKIHQKLHQPRERKHKCDQCESTFYDEKHLVYHIKHTHLGEGAKHLCNICGVAITTATNLRNHMRVHTGEKPHICKVCGRAFAQIANLKRHRVTHTKEKPHRCETCGKGFPLRDGLKRHMLTHSGEKPFKCDVCEMSFNQRSNLRTHMLLHNPDKPHKCAKCDKAYNHKVCLLQHMKSHHGIDMK